ALKRIPDIELFISSDFSQMELRVLSQVANDPYMIQVFLADGDIHVEVGSLWTGWTAAEIKNNESYRAVVKQLHFAVIYGKTPVGLWMGLKAAGWNWTLEQVESYHRLYFEKMKLVAKYVENQHKFAEANGYVDNLFGFRFPLEVRPDDPH